MSTLLLSGWAQPADALAHLAPGATRYDYSHHASAEEAIAGLEQFNGHENVIGWSLGGQLALRAIAAGVLAPKRLVLIGAPARFVGPNGMGEQTFSLFRDSYAKDPARTKDRFHALVAKGDRQAKRVLTELDHHPEVEDSSRFLPWLDVLEGFDAATLDLSQAPRTLILHGMNDAIVPYAQGELLSRMLPHATLHGLEGVGHAPHLSESERVLEAIRAHGVA